MLINLYEYPSTMAQSIAIFYIFVLSSYCYFLLPCYQRDFMQKSKIALYTLGFVCFYFMVSFVSQMKNVKYEPPIQKLIHSISAYALFIVCIRLDYRIVRTVLIILCSMYFIQVNIDYYMNSLDKNKNATAEQSIDDYNYWITLDYPVKIRFFPVNKNQLNILNKAMSITFYIVICLIIFGFICYIGEIKELKKKDTNITWLHLLTDNKVCKPGHINKTLFEHFKNGLFL